MNARATGNRIAVSTALASEIPALQQKTIQPTVGNAMNMATKQKMTTAAPMENPPPRVSRPMAMMTATAMMMKDAMVQMVQQRVVLQVQQVGSPSELGMAVLKDCR